MHKSGCRPGHRISDPTHVRRSEFSDKSPGRIHPARVIEAAFAEGLHGIELLSPASDYKPIWLRDVREPVDLSLVPSGLWRLRHATWYAGARPVIKSA